MLDETGITPPIRTQFSFAEDLSGRFEPGKFDLITCMNALDHALEPMWGILEMMLVLSNGGKIFLSHAINEAENEKYSGFHQWNFDMVDAKFTIWNQKRRLVVDEVLGDSAKVVTAIAGSGINVRIEKLRNFDLELVDYQRRLRAAVLSAFVSSKFNALASQGHV
jgi:hypothetical protein